MYRSLTVLLILLILAPVGRDWVNEWSYVPIATGRSISTASSTVTITPSPSTHYSPTAINTLRDNCVVPSSTHSQDWLSSNSTTQLGSFWWYMQWDTYMHFVSRMVIRCSIVGTSHDGKIVQLPQIPLESLTADTTVRFICHQFPVRLPFAMTINKAQAQSLASVGVLLNP